MDNQELILLTFEVRSTLESKGIRELMRDVIFTSDTLMDEDSKFEDLQEDTKTGFNLN